MKEWNEYQKEVFENIKKCSVQVDRLSSFVQNDFERMLEDGTVTKQYIKEIVGDVNLLFTNAEVELKKLQGKVLMILEHYILEVKE